MSSCARFAKVVKKKQIPLPNWQSVSMYSVPHASPSGLKMQILVLFAETGNECLNGTSQYHILLIWNFQNETQCFRTRSIILNIDHVGSCSWIYFSVSARQPNFEFSDFYILTFLSFPFIHESDH